MELAEPAPPGQLIGGWSAMSEEDLATVVAKSDAPAVAYAAWARCAVRREDWAAALARWDRCLSAFPGKPASAWREAKARALRGLGRFREAEAELLSLTQGAEPKPSAFAALARLAMETRDWPLALKRWDECLAAFPNHQKEVSHICRATVLRELGQSDQADVLLSELVRSGEATSRAYEAWAISATRRREWSVSVARWTHVLSIAALEPKPEWRLFLAMSLAELDRVAEMEIHLRLYVAAARRGSPGAAQSSDVAARAMDPVELALATTELIAGAKVAAELRRRADAAFAAEGRAAGLQHLRNLMLACAYNDAPQELRELLNARPQSAHLGWVEMAATLLDRVLIDNFTAARRPLRAARREAPARTLIVACDMPRNSTGPHKRLICSYAASLAMTDGSEAIQVLITQELAPEGPRVTDGPMGPERIEEWYEEIGFLAGSKAGAKVRFAMPKRVGRIWPYSEAFRLADQFRPDLILAFQGIYHSRILPPVLARHTPVIAVQSNRNCPEPDYCDLVLAHGARADFNGMPHPEKWRSHAIPVLPFPKLGHVEVSELGPPADFRVATALSHGRLEKALLAHGGRLLDRVIAFLDAHPDAVWLMVGMIDIEGMESALKLRRQDGLRGRLRFMPWADDLRGVYEHCHAYMHPARDAGGAMALAMAIAEGLAVLAPGETDAANFLAPETVYLSEEDGFVRLCELAGNNNLCEHVARVQKEYMETHNSFASAGLGLQELLPDALINFYRRMASST